MRDLYTKAFRPIFQGQLPEGVRLQEGVRAITFSALQDGFSPEAIVEAIVEASTVVCPDKGISKGLAQVHVAWCQKNTP